jgi:NitT/TauT family transport system substrate-binding protein
MRLPSRTDLHDRTPRPHPRRARWAARAAALLALAAGVPASHAASSTAEPLAIAAARSPLSLPLFVAQERGFLADAGLDARVEECSVGARCLRQLDEGRVDVATTSELPVVFDAFGRTGAAVIATLATTSDDLKLVVRKELAGLPAVKLAGHRIGMMPASASQYFVDMLLMNLGIDPRGAELVELTPETALQALRSGRVDALAVNEPLAYQAMHLGDVAAVRLPVDSVYIETFDLVAGPRILGRRDEALVRLVAAIDRAERFIHDDPRAAQAILRRRLGVDQAFVDALWPGLAYRLTLDRSLLATMDSELRWARRERRVGASVPPDVRELVYAGPLKVVQPTANVGD